MEKIVVPLDGFKSKKELMGVVEEIQKAEILAGESLIWGFKVNDALVEYGTSIIRRIKNEGFRVFADPKLYDIPNTMSNSINTLLEAGAEIVTVHCSADYKPLKEQAPYLAGVTVLTSMDEKRCYYIYGNLSFKIIPLFARIAEENNYGYLVCSAKDLELISTYYPDIFGSFKKICPGIRPEYCQKDDQKRVMTVFKAIEAGADLLVIGRPILQAKNRIEAIQRINEEIKRALENE